MAVKHTIERILRDDDDASGQSIREWKIEAQQGHGFVTIRMNHGDGFILMSADDTELFIADICSARDVSKRKDDAQ